MAYVPVTITDDRLAEFDAEHDGILIMRGSERAPFLYVLRRPTEREARAYQGMLRGKDPDVMKANRLFLTSMCVHPTGAELEGQIARWPASPGAVLASEAFTEFSGAAATDLRK